MYQSSNSIAQQNNLSRLSNELLAMTFQDLTPADKTALSLTCKEYCGMIESAKILDPQPLKRRPVTKEMRLAVLVRLHDWMPADYVLCYSCVRFLPKMDNAPWRGDVQIKKDRLATKKAINLGPRCSSCASREELGVVKARTDAQRLTAMIRML